MRAVLIATVITTVVCGTFVIGAHWWWTPTPEVRLVCQSADKPIEIGRGRITYSDGLYRFTDITGVESTYDKSAFESCYTAPIGVPR